MLLVFLAALAVALFRTRRDWTLKPASFLQGYLLFTVVFYSYRWIFQWGTPETTLYEGDAPGYVRIIKDLVFVGFVLLGLWKRKFSSSPIIWYVGPIVAWFSLCSYMKLLALQDSHAVLFYWRMPLEYMPLCFMNFDEEFEGLQRFIVGLCWIVIGFLGMEVLSGRVSGFAKGGLYTRYGSIFGSPNELGVFVVLMLLCLLVFSDRIPEATRALLVLSLSIALVLTGSRSSMVGLVAGLISLWPRSKRWLGVIGIVAVVGCMFLMFAFRDIDVMGDLTMRATDETAMARLDQLDQVKSEIGGWGISSLVFGSWRHLFVENFYLAILLRAGFLGLGLLALLLAATLVRSTHPFLRAGIVSVLSASFFVPYLDVFPINVYFWLMVGAVWRLSRKPEAALRTKGSLIGRGAVA
jgi:hypothetical protein